MQLQPGADVLPARDPALGGDAERLSDALADLARIYQLQDPRETCSFGITLTECYALEAVVLRGPLTINEIAASLGVDKSTASRAAAGLVRKRRASRRGHPQDGRALQLTATVSGARLFEQIRSSGRRTLLAIATDFSPGVRRGAIALLRRVVAAERACAGRDYLPCE